MRIILGADHGGFLMKEKVKEFLLRQGNEVVDVGAETLDENDDYVDFAKAAVGQMTEEDRVILFCRNGFGMCIVANRKKGVRCGIGFDKNAVIKGRNDDDINVLSVPSDYLNAEEIIETVEAFLGTGFSTDFKYQRRINKIDS